MTQRGLAIVNMLIYVVLFSILSGVVLGVLSSSTRELERSIRRTKGFYAAQAASVYALDQLNQVNTFPGSPLSVAWSHDLAGNVISVKPVALSNAPGIGPDSTMLVNTTINYTTNW